ncbi:MAG: hypothetical protein AB7I04_20730 [Pseudomonadales bacterium]
MSEVAFLPSLLTGAIGWLDALPDGLRAMLAALVLAALLAAFERRIPLREVQYGRSFRKSALVALLLIPLLVWLLPASRMVVFVEDLPQRSDAAHPLAIAICAIWLIGWIVSTLATVRVWHHERAAILALPQVEDAALSNRLAHWRTRLGMAAPAAMHVSPGEQPGFFGSGRRLLFPSAATRWPTNQQDVLIINALCSLKHRHHRWHRYAQLVCCVYWPVTWLQKLHENLQRDFELTASDLADSCYQDRLGYGRTLRQLEQRLHPAASRRSPREDRATRPADALLRYGIRVSGLLRPADPAWRVDRLLAARNAGEEARWKDPYDRVVLFVGQAVFLAVLLTGVTLEQRPPDVEEKYLVPFGLLWKEHFHRNLELNDRAQPKS